MLYLVRHGRTAANVQGRLQGRIDPPLDGVGEDQAAAMAAHVGRLAKSSGGVTLLVASPLKRAQQTASAYGVPVEIDVRWTEMNYGIYEGVEVSSVPDDVWQSWFTDADYSVGEGESFNQLAARVGEALESIADVARTSNVVVVSHAGAIKAALGWALGLGHEIAFRCHLSYGSLCQIDFGRFGPRVYTVNETVATR